MPIHVRGISRRQLLQGAAAAGAGLLLPGCVSGPVFRGLAGPAPTDSERWVVMSDPHICADTKRGVRGINMADHLRTAVDAALSQSEPVAGLFVNGDCAYESGSDGDYKAFRDVLLNRIESAGVPLHLALGNHDHRARFLAALERERYSPVPSRWVSVVPMRHANLFLLDSHDPGHWLTGRIGPEQLRWLDESLKAASDKPALVMAHHPPDPITGVLERDGLADATALNRVLESHEHVKAFIFGHTHLWNVTKPRGMYLVSLPATAYVFSADQPSGWIDAHVGSDGAELTLWAINGRRTEPLPGRSAMLRWG